MKKDDAHIEKPNSTKVDDKVLDILSKIDINDIPKEVRDRCYIDYEPLLQQYYANEEENSSERSKKRPLKIVWEMDFELAKLYPGNLDRKQLKAALLKLGYAVANGGGEEDGDQSILVANANKNPDFYDDLSKLNACYRQKGFLYYLIDEGQYNASDANAEMQQVDSAHFDTFEELSVATKYLVTCAAKEILSKIGK